jgi:hypothetical protein
VTTSLISQGLSPAKASAEASRFSQSQGASGNAAAIPHYIRLDFADASRSVFYAMAGIMAVAAVVALLGLKRGLQQDQVETVGEDSVVVA